MKRKDQRMILTLRNGMEVIRTKGDEKEQIWKCWRWLGGVMAVVESGESGRGYL